MKFRIARLWSPRPPRHAYPTGTGRRRAATPSAPKTAPTMAQRPRVDYTDPSPLPHVETGRDGMTAVFHRIDETPAVPGPLGCDDITMTWDAVSAAVDPHNWYNDLPLPPSQLGPDRASAAGDAMRSHVVEALGNSALTHTAGPADAWFRAEAADAKIDNSLKAFHRRTAAWLNSSTPAAPRHDVGYVLDTSVFATVAAPEFTGTRSGALR